MKRLLAKIALHVYTEFIYEDWSVYTKLGKNVIYPFWMIRTLLVILVSPVLSIDYFWKKSDLYKISEESKLQSVIMMETMFNK